MFSEQVISEDPVKVAPHAYKVLIENERVRVLETRLKPGEKADMHWHPSSVVCGLGPNQKVKFTLPGGNLQEVQINTGDAVWFEAGSHASENIGTTEAYNLIIELKK